MFQQNMVNQAVDFGRLLFLYPKIKKGVDAIAGGRKAVRYIRNGCKRTGRIEWRRSRGKTDLGNICGGWAGRKV